MFSHLIRCIAVVKSQKPAETTKRSCIASDTRSRPDMKSSPSAEQLSNARGKAELNNHESH